MKFHSIHAYVNWNCNGLIKYNSKWKFEKRKLHIGQNLKKMYRTTCSSVCIYTFRTGHFTFLFIDFGLDIGFYARVYSDFGVSCTIILARRLVIYIVIFSWKHVIVIVTWK